ncbi:hypothetical protein M758_2G223500 [Ceratodon purpureus]|nr:hypothetical protein M758_2G223500 [Ceratodon purpureus]
MSCMLRALIPIVLDHLVAISSCNSISDRGSDYRGMVLEADGNVLPYRREN